MWLREDIAASTSSDDLNECESINYVSVTCIISTFSCGLVLCLLALETEEAPLEILESLESWNPSMGICKGRNSNCCLIFPLLHVAKYVQGTTTVWNWQKLRLRTYLHIGDCAHEHKSCSMCTHINMQQKYFPQLFQDLGIAFLNSMAFPGFSWPHKP